MSDTDALHNRDVWAKWKSKEDNFAKYKPIRSTLIYGDPAQEKPTVSIAIPAYRKAGGLKGALDSALGQDYDLPYEIVVVDDSGFDQQIDDLMKEYCREYQNILYYRNDDNLGVYGNWNRLCELCRTDWYCMLHDDDRMRPDYLSTCVSTVSQLPATVGLMGIYIETFDAITNEVRNTLIDKLVGIFISMRSGKPIRMSIKDNAKYIFALACCMFISREKFIEIGGFNDEFYPSSDLVLTAKMNYYYDTVFLPVILSERGVGINNSLKQSLCDASVRAAYDLTMELTKELGKSPKKQKRKASFAAVIAEIAVRGYNNVDYSDVKSSLGMKNVYNKSFVVNFINLYSKFNWGLLLFRGGMKPGRSSP